MDRRHEDLLRRLAINDEAVLENVLHTSLADVRDCAADARFVALVRIAALIALQPSGASLNWAVAAALASGATEQDIVDVLVSVAPIVGVARVSWSASELAIALELEDRGEAREASR